MSNADIAEYLFRTSN